MPKTKQLKRLEALERLERYQTSMERHLALLVASDNDAEQIAQTRASITARTREIAYLRTLVDAR